MITQELKDKWAAALRSGDYKQGRGMLYDGAAYCCLGVLCRIQGRKVGIETSFDPASYWWLDDVIGHSARSEFVNANDKLGKTFAEIADMVDALPTK